MVRAAEAVDDEETLTAELINGKFLKNLPCFDRARLIVIFELGSCPPDRGFLSFFGRVVVNDKFVFRAASSIDSRHNVQGTELGFLRHVVARQPRSGFLVKQNFIRGVVDNLFDVGDAVAAEIHHWHNFYLHKFFVNCLSDNKLSRRDCQLTKLHDCAKKIDLRPILC